MERDIELLCPGGDVDSVKAAIAAGADAVYCGLDRFNARNRASNLSFEDLNKLLVLAHRNRCKIFLTLNIIFVDSEIPALFKLLNQIANTEIDGIIVQDLGLLYILNNYYKNLEIHASTQLTTHNRGQIKFLKKLNVSRVNLSRELNLNEINRLTSYCHKNNMETEVFVHGSYCIGFSGLCYFSSYLSGNSGNRGRCSQPCRDRYKLTSNGKSYPLNLKDNSAFKDIGILFDAGVDSLKIEGRIKGADYVYTAARSYKKQIKRVQNHKEIWQKDSDLKKVFNRNFSDSFLTGDIGRKMFIDDPRDSMNVLSKEEQEKIYEDKGRIKKEVKEKISFLMEEKIPVKIRISGSEGEKLVIDAKTPDFDYSFASKSDLTGNPEKKAKEPDLKFFRDRFKTLSDGSFKIEDIDIENLKPDLFIPFGDITKIKNEIFFGLNGFEYVNPLDVPKIKKSCGSKTDKKLSVLISSEEDIGRFYEVSGNLFFELPESLKNRFSELRNIFQKNRKLIPWFPAIILPDSFEKAVDFLEEVKPEFIVTNNTGIALEALKREIDWIPGPHLNIANSFSLLLLKEKFHCKGAFISNELTGLQVKQIKKPENIRLFYSICHPLLLLKSRQCLFQQVTGCNKESVDEDCINNCEKTSHITNINGANHIIEKSKDNHHSLYNNYNYLNTNVVKECESIFTDFLLDFRHIKTETRFMKSKPDMVKLFDGFIKGNLALENEIHESITPSTNGNWDKNQGGF